MSGIEIAGLVLSYVESISTLASLFLKRERGNRKSVELYEDAQKSATEIERSVDELSETLDERSAKQLQQLSRSLPDIRAKLRDPNDHKQVTSAVSCLKDEESQLRRLSTGGDVPMEPAKDLLRDTQARWKLTPLYVPAIQISDVSIHDLRQGYPGLYQVYHPREGSPESDIIFVHGLGADPWSTWASHRDQMVYWPRDFLPSDMRRSVIWIYSYNADIDMSGKSQEPLKDVLESMGSQLQHRVEYHTKTSSLIWVAHSLGGLVVKSALTRSRLQHRWTDRKSTLEHTQLQPDPIFKRTKGVLFMGTPHDGSSPTSRAARFTNILSVFSGFHPALRHDSLRGERRFDSTITLMTFDFAALMDEQQYSIVSLFETKQLPTDSGPRIIVEKFAFMDHDRETVDEIEGNHVTMCRFATKEERGYQTVLNHLRVLNGTSPEYKLDDEELAQSPTGSKLTSASDAETTDISTLYTRARLKVDVPAARWRSLKARSHLDGRWFLSTQAYRDWLDVENSHPMLICGPVGCGKTMIAESVLEDLRGKSVGADTASRSCHLHLFFRSDQAAQQSPVTILQALIAQTLDQNNALVRHWKRASFKIENESKLVQAQLKGILRRMVEDTCWSVIYLVVDALDECHASNVSSSAELLLWMLRVPKLRAIFTTSTSLGPDGKHQLTRDGQKDETNLASLIKADLASSRLGPKIHDIKLQEFKPWTKAVTKYIDDRLGIGEGRNSGKVSVSIKMPTRNRLAMKSILVDLPHVSFSVVDLAIQHINHGHPYSIDGELFTRQLDDLHDMTRIYGSLVALAARQPDLCIWIISILACAVKPLRASELSILLHYDRNSEYSTPMDYSETAKEMLEKVASSDMKHLVTVDGDGLHLASDMVRRAIRRQIELKTHSSIALNDPVNSRFEDYEHLQWRIARSCLRILLSLAGQTEYELGTHKSTKVLPGRSYARKYWVRHVQEAGDCATALNSLITRYEASQPSPNSSPTRLSRPFSMQRSLFLRLTRKNLSCNLGSIFGDSADSLAIPDPSEIDRVLESLESEPAPSSDTLQTLRRINNRINSPGDTQKEIRDLRLSLIQRIEKNDHLTIQADLERLEFPSEDLVSFLKVSIEAQSVECVRHILQRLSQTRPEAKGREMLSTAVQFNNLQLVQAMLEHRDLFDLESSLIVAIDFANLSICKELLACGAKVNAPGGSDSPLHMAAATGVRDIVVLLLTWNAFVNALDAKKRTPLHLAAEFGHADVVWSLLSNSASLVARDHKLRTAFFLACACGHPKTAEILWEAGARLSDKDRSGRTALHAAAGRGQEEIVELLLGAGSNPNIQDNWGATPIHMAAEGGWASIVQKLLKAGADINMVSKKRESQAVSGEMRSSSTTEISDDEQTENSETNERGGVTNYSEVETPLSIATGRQTEAEALGQDGKIVRGRAIVLKRTVSQSPQLIFARDLDIKRRKISLRPQGMAAFHFACKTTNAPEAVLQILCDNGADPKAVDGWNRTPVLIAAQYSTVRSLNWFAELDRNMLLYKDSQGRGVREYAERLDDIKAKTKEEAKLELAERRANRRDKRSFLEHFFSKPALDSMQELSDNQYVLIE
jgi:ankyrin repeat protein